MVFSPSSFNVIQVVYPKINRQRNGFEPPFQHLQHKIDQRGPERAPRRAARREAREYSIVKYGRSELLRGSAVQTAGPQHLTRLVYKMPAWQLHLFASRRPQPPLRAVELPIPLRLHLSRSMLTWLSYIILIHQPLSIIALK